MPYFFKPELMKAIKDTINENIEAEVDFADIDISFFKSLPKINISIKDFEIIGIQDFKGKTLMSSQITDIKTDFNSVFKSGQGLTLYSIELSNPIFNLIVNEDEVTNYNITKEQDVASSDSQIFGSIEHYALNNATLNYVNKANNLNFSLNHLEHTGKGNFKDVVFDLQTETTSDDLDLTYDGIRYLKNAKITGEVDLAIDLNNDTYKFKQNNLKINDLDLSFLGKIQLFAEAIDFDLKINAPNNEVSSILSIIPNAYTSNYSNVTSKGTSNLNGSIVGQYNYENSTLPNIKLNLNLTDGYLQYPNLALPIEDINTDLVIKAQDSNWNDLSVNFSNFTFLINNKRVDGQLMASNILNNSKLNGKLKGELDLKELSNAFPLPDFDINSGNVKFDAELVSKLSDIQNRNYSNISFKGQLEGKNLDLIYGQDKAFKSDKLIAAFSPQTIDVSTSRAELGESDFSGKIQINDPLSYITNHNQTNITGNVKSNKLNIDQLQKTFITEEVDTLDYSKTSIPNMDINYSADDIKYEDYNIKNLNATISYNQDNELNGDGAFYLDGSKMNLRAQLNNVDQFINDDDALKGKMFVEIDNIDSNKYLTESGEAESETVYQVPANYNLEIYPTIKKLIYDNYIFNDLTGKIKIDNGIAQLENGQTKLFNGKIKFEGKYDTQQTSEPTVDFKYNMDDLEFQKMFQNSKSFKFLAPIAEYIEGIFNSTLVISGPLNKDMSFDLSRINASGYFETVKGKVSGFEPLKKLSDVLKIDALNNWDIKDSRNWFEINNGIVNIKPHEYTFEDMTFNVSGNHSITQNINYTINAKIPRDKLKKANLGSVLESGMSSLEEAAKSRGVNINLGENIFLDIYITNTIKSPKIKIIPVGSGGKTLQEVVKDKVKEEISVLKDTVSQELEKKTKEIKDSVSKVVKKELDTIKTKVEDKVKKEADIITDKLKDKIGEKVDSSVIGTVKDSLESKIGDKVGDLLKGGTKEDIDSLKEVLNDWNPFKKKKKN